MVRKKDKKQKGKKKRNSKKSPKPVAKPKSPVAKGRKKKAKDSAAPSGRRGTSSSGKNKEGQVEIDDDNVTYLPVEERTFTADMIPRANQVLEKILKLNEERKKIQMKLAKLLYEVKQNQYYVHYKDDDGNAFNSFEGFVVGKLKEDLRKAYALKQIWAKLHVEGGLSAKELEQIPWTKAQMIASESNSPEEMEEWKEKAIQMPYGQFKKEVDKNRKNKRRRKEIVNHKNFDNSFDDEDTEKKPKTDEKWERLLVYLSEDQNEVIEAAIKAATGPAKSEKKNQVLSLICQEWLAFYSKNKTEHERLAALLARLSTNSGYEIYSFPKNVRSKKARKEIVNNILDDIYDLFGIEAHIADE